MQEVRAFWEDQDEKGPANLGEVDAALDAERLQGSLEPGSFYVHLQDSQVSLACLVKGRSSSKFINKRLKASVSDHISNNNRAIYGYVRSKKNPADAPTRNRAIDEPMLEVPLWLAEAEQGRFELLDQFLKERHADVEALRGLPHESELHAPCEVDVRSCRVRKRQQRKELKVGRIKKMKRREEIFEQPVEKTKEKGRESSEGRVLIAPKKAEASPEVLLVLHSARCLHADTASAAADSASVFFEQPVEKTKEKGRESSEGRVLIAPKKVEASPEVLLVLHSARCLHTDTTSAAADSASVFSTAHDTYISPPSLKGLTPKLRSLLNKFHLSQFLISPSFQSLDEAFDAGPGILDLFAGSRGFSKACVRHAPTWTLTFDLAHSPSEDLLSLPLQESILDLVRLGAFLAMGAGPVCASFSQAITPPVRTKEYPEGVPWASPLQAARVCLDHDVVFWVENPSLSWLWRQAGTLSWDDILADRRVGDWVLDYCRFGTPWRKRTRFRTSGQLKGQKCVCVCQRPHVQLRGHCKSKGVLYTKLAEPYPRGVAETLAWATLCDSGLLPKR